MRAALCRRSLAADLKSNSLKKWEVKRQSRVSPSPQFRYVVLTVWVLSCVVLGWVSLTEQRLFERVFFGIFSILGACLLLVLIEEESALVSNHTLAYDVGSYRRRRGRWIGPKCQYRFTTLDATMKHLQAATLGPENELQPCTIHFLPRKNKPLAAFIFYRFQFPEASS